MGGSLAQKGDTDFHPVDDYRNLNTITTPDRYLSTSSAGLFIHSTWMHNLFHNRPSTHIPPDSSEPGRYPPNNCDYLLGSFEFLFMPFRFHIVASTCQRYIDEVAHSMDFVFVYVDVLLIVSVIVELHHQHLTQLFQHSQSTNIIVNPAKWNSWDMS